MPNISCLCTSYPFSARGRVGTCFYSEGGVSVCCCCAPAFPARVVLSLGEFAVPLLPNEHRPVVCSAHLPAVGLKPSLTRCTNAQLSHEHLHCSLHTFRHNIYNCTWSWSIALFQINDHTVYLLGFCSFSAAKASAVPELLARECCRAFYGGPELPAPCWACNQSCAHSFSQHWHLCPSDSQGASHVPQLPWVSHPLASNALGAFLPCGADVLLGDKVGTQPLKRMPEARPANDRGGHTLLISCNHPGKSSRLKLSQGLSNS